MNRRIACFRHTAHTRPSRRRPAPLAAPRRGGFTLMELLVAATLLATVISTIARLTVHNGRIQRDARHSLVALDELSNQLDRLTALDTGRLPAAIDDLTVSDFAQNVLPSPELSAEILADSAGDRLMLRISWDRPGGRVPLTLIGWVDSPRRGAGESP